MNNGPQTNGRAAAASGTKAAIVILLILAVALAVYLKGRGPAASDPSEPVAVAVAVAVYLEGRDPATTDPPEPVAAAAVPLPRLLDLGSVTCIPCKAMAPILDGLREEYAGKFNVEFIDVWQDELAGKAYNITTIPTQIFFDADGKELFRHIGFFSKKDILGAWQELGFQFDGPQPSAAKEPSPAE